LADGGFRAADPRLDQRLQRQSDVAGSLSRELKLLASIVELGNDAITDDGIITNWNKAAEQLFGVCEVCSHWRIKAKETQFSTVSREVIASSAMKLFARARTEV
jgi:PAS domain-containing protein